MLDLVRGVQDVTNGRQMPGGVGMTTLKEELDKIDALAKLDAEFDPVEGYYDWLEKVRSIVGGDKEESLCGDHFYDGDALSLAIRLMKEGILLGYKLGLEKALKSAKMWKRGEEIENDILRAINEVQKE